MTPVSRIRKLLRARKVLLANWCQRTVLQRRISRRLPKISQRKSSRLITKRKSKYNWSKRALQFLYSMVRRMYSSSQRKVFSTHKSYRNGLGGSFRMMACRSSWPISRTALSRRSCSSTFRYRLKIGSMSCFKKLEATSFICVTYRSKYRRARFCKGLVFSRETLPSFQNSRRISRRYWLSFRIVLSRLMTWWTSKSSWTTTRSAPLPWWSSKRRMGSHLALCAVTTSARTKRSWEASTISLSTTRRASSCQRGRPKVKQMSRMRRSKGSCLKLFFLEEPKCSSASTKRRGRRNWGGSRRGGHCSQISTSLPNLGTRWSHPSARLSWQISKR